MVVEFKKYLQSILLLSIFTVVLGGIYPFTLYLVNQSLFTKKANNSLVSLHDEIKGSVLLGQTFSDPSYFWGRPSLEEKKTRIEQYNQLQKKHALPNIFAESEFPAEFISPSASDLDPHISIQSARIQLDRVSRETGRYRGILEDYILLSTEPRQFGLFGQPRVNVVKLNLLIHANQ